MAKLRESAKIVPLLKEKYTASLAAVKEEVNARFSRPIYCGERVQVAPVASYSQVDGLIEHIQKIIPGVASLPSSKFLANCEEWHSFLKRHAVQRTYWFQLRKCDDRSCCSAPTLDMAGAPSIVDPEPSIDGKSFKSWQASIRSAGPTSEKFCPSIISGTSHSADSFRHDNLKGIWIRDREAALVCRSNASCWKQRVMYAPSKTFSYQKKQDFIHFLTEIEGKWTCGTPLVGKQHPLFDVVGVRQNLICSSAMEIAYYRANLIVRGAGHERVNIDTCFHCGKTEMKDPNLLHLRQSYSAAFKPSCTIYQTKGKEHRCGPKRQTKRKKALVEGDSSVQADGAGGAVGAIVASVRLPRPPVLAPRTHRWS
jgi:hypothetical protein